MPRLRRLSGAELVRIFRGFGFVLHSTRSSPMKLRRIREDGTTETLTIGGRPPKLTCCNQIQIACIRTPVHHE